MQSKKQAVDIPFIVNSVVPKGPKSQIKKVEIELQEIQRFAFIKPQREQREVEKEKLTLDELTAQLRLQEKKVKSSEYHIMHHGIKRIHTLAKTCEIPVPECRTIVKALLPLFERDNHIVIECCKVVVELARQTKNVRPMFEEGLLDSVIGLLHSLDSDVLLAGIRAINVFSGEGVYLMHFAEKPNTISAIVSLIYSNQNEIRDISRSLYFKLKANREFLMEEVYSLSDDPWNMLFYKWRMGDVKNNLIQYAKHKTDKGDEITDIN